MPVRHTVTTLALATCAALLATPTAGASWLKPTSRVSGQVRVAWNGTRNTFTEPKSVEGAIRYDVVGRAASGADAVAWAGPGGSLPRDDKASRFPGFLIRTRITVERYTARQPGSACGDGQVPQTTATSAAAGPTNAIVDTFEPHLDLVRRSGTIEVVPAVDGTVPVTRTGTTCATPSDGSVAVQVALEPSTGEVTVADMLGDDLVRALSSLDDLPLTIMADRSFVIRTTRKLNLDTGDGRTDATVAFDLRVAGPPAAQSGDCVAPTYREIRSLRTPADVQRLARRRGFSRIVVGAPRLAGAFDRGARYRFGWGVVTYPCGRSLGDRKDPFLFPLKRAP